EKGKARHYWRFNLLIAYSQARLAVIAESEGKKDEAERLFASASEYMVLQTCAFAEECRRTHVQVLGYSDVETRFTPDRWRKNVAALDLKANVKWKEPKQQGGLNGRQLLDLEIYLSSSEAAF